MSIEIKNFRDYKSFKETHQRAIVFMVQKIVTPVSNLNPSIKDSK